MKYKMLYTKLINNLNFKLCVQYVMATAAYVKKKEAPLLMPL